MLAYILLTFSVLMGFVGVMALLKCSVCGLDALVAYVRDIHKAPSLAMAVPPLEGAATELHNEIVALHKAWIVAEQRAEEAQRGLAASLNEATTALEQLTSHDLMHENTLGTMRKISSKAAHVTQDLTADTRKLSQLVADVDNGVEVQLIRLREAHEGMQAMVHSVAESAGNAQAASKGAHISRDKAEVGAREVGEAVAAISTVKGTVLALRDAMTVLGEKAGNIGAVMGVINEVADQTNLLALNAAIEAARAGEAGRGFSVVADEVRKLAEKTMSATKEVEEAVHSIQEEAKRNVQAVEKAALHTVEGAECASRAGVFMTEIVQRMDETATQLSSIAAATEQQAHTSAQSNEALQEIKGVASKTAAHMQTFMSALVKLSSSMEEVDMIIHALDTGDLEAAATEQMVAWTPKLELGLTVIDTQHRTLCNYINALHKAMKENKDKEKLRELLVGLKDYTVSHFRTEEEYFSHSAYPDTQKHKKVHQDFVAKVADFEQRFSKDPSALSMELLEFLKDWLIKHICGTDKHYVSHVLEAQRKLK